MTDGPASASPASPAERFAGGGLTLEPGRIATLTLSAPERRNAIRQEMWAALPAICARIAADPAVRVVIVRGAGGHFSARGRTRASSRTATGSAEAAGRTKMPRAGGARRRWALARCRCWRASAFPAVGALRLGLLRISLRQAEGAPQSASRAGTSPACYPELRPIRGSAANRWVGLGRADSLFSARLVGACRSAAESYLVDKGGGGR